MQKKSSTWLIPVALGVVFVALFVPIGLFAFGEPYERPTVMGLIFAGIGVVVGVICLGGAVAMRREGRAVADGGPLLTVVPAPTPVQAPTPWPVPAFAAELARRLEGAPYQVLASANTIQVVANLADARFLSWLNLNRVKVLAGTQVQATGPGRYRQLDTRQALEWEVGLDGALVPRARGSVETFAGRRWSYETRTVTVFGPDGVTTPVDYTFSTADIAKPLHEVAKQAGWRTVMPAEQRIGLMAGIFGGVIALGTVIGLLIAL